MGSLNKALVIGRLGRDPEVRYTQGGQAVANFSIATDERWKGKNGEQEQRTEWHRIVAWGRQAELAGEFLSKGRQVYVEGRLQTREWEDRDGNKRTTTEINALSVQFLGGRGGAGGGAPPDGPPGGDPPGGDPPGGGPSGGGPSGGGPSGGGPSGGGPSGGSPPGPPPGSEVPF